MATNPTPDQHLTRNRRTGILVLAGLLMILLALWHWLPDLLKPPADKEAPVLQAAWAQFKAAQGEEDDEADHTPGATGTATTPVAVTTQLFPFDPNTASEQDLLRLGLPPGTARTLIKYRSKGGHFYRTEDLRKLYTLKPSDYERLAPYVRITGGAAPQDKPYERQTYNAYPVRSAATPASLELNSADMAALVRLKGIGPVFAGRILRYRDALGGFVDVAQLKEVYGLPDSVYQQCSAVCTADPGRVQLINVNTATEADLARHPYIRTKLASGIIKLRNDLESFREIAQIRQVPLINDEKYRKIAPYLRIH